MSKIHLVILSRLRLVESSTTTSTPDLLLVVLLLLQHLSSLTIVLLDSELGVIHYGMNLLWPDGTSPRTS